MPFLLLVSFFIAGEKGDDGIDEGNQEKIEYKIDEGIADGV
jgi:hypothetical protein